MLRYSLTEVTWEIYAALGMYQVHGKVNDCGMEQESYL